MAEDDESLRVMLGELKNPDARIREPALEAVRQCGRREAIPVLEAFAAQAPDSVEAVALKETADFLALPSVSEMRDRLRPERAIQEAP